MIRRSPLPETAGARCFRLELPSDPATIPWVSLGLRGFLRATGWNRRESFRLDLAVNEALHNAMLHGNQQAHDRTVELLVADDGQMTWVEVWDRGAGFNPDAVQPVVERNEALAEGGRGVVLMRRLTDEFEVHHGPQGTCVRMLKYHASGREPRRAA